jgi:hypothetical protein
VPERREQTGRVFGGGNAIGVDVDTADRVRGEHPDSQATGIGADLVGERPRRCRRDHRVAGERLPDSVENSRRVAHRAGQHQLDVEDHRELPETRAERCAAA